MVSAVCHGGAIFQASKINPVPPSSKTRESLASLTKVKEKKVSLRPLIRGSVLPLRSLRQRGSNICIISRVLRFIKISGWKSGKECESCCAQATAEAAVIAFDRLN
jgi:hypothetical protein